MYIEKEAVIMQESKFLCKKGVNATADYETWTVSTSNKQVCWIFHQKGNLIMGNLWPGLFSCFVSCFGLT